MAPGQPIEDFDVVVIGGGIMGLSTAWALSERAPLRIALLERAEVGHRKGSSNGRVRIARTTYADPGYVRLMLRGRADAWAELERQLGSTLIRPVDGCFFGPKDGLIESYAEGVAVAGGPASRITLSQAQNLFGTLNLNGCAVVHDRSAGVINAETTRSGLRSLMDLSGVDVRCETTVKAIHSEPDVVRLETSSGSVRTRGLVITAGAWAQELIPRLETRLMVHRQDIGYYRTPQSSATPGGDFAWVYLGCSQDEVYYGLPESDRLLKTAHHRRSGPADDPNAAPSNRTAALDALDGFVAQRFTPRLMRDHASTCPYTSTETDDFILDAHPEDPRIVIGAGFSGHGFKFGPIIGRILAELVLDGRSGIDEFNAMRHQLSINGPQKQD